MSPKKITSDSIDHYQPSNPTPCGERKGREMFPYVQLEKCETMSPRTRKVKYNDLLGDKKVSTRQKE